MFKYIFNSNNEEEDNEEEDNEEEDNEEEDNEEEDNEEEDNEEIIIYEGQYSPNISLRTYSCFMRIKISFIKEWSFNRMLNPDHIVQIKNSLRTLPIVIGTVKLIRKREDIQSNIIDGQHRIAAIRSLLHENSEFDIRAIFEEYTVEDLDNEDSRSLYNMCNNNLNVLSLNFPSNKFMEIVNNMCIKYPSAIIDKDIGNVQRPKITKKSLALSLRSKMTDEWLYLYTTQEIITNIQNINNRIGLMNDFSELFGRKNPKDSKIRILEKAQKINFFLNLDCKFSLEYWINNLL